MKKYLILAFLVVAIMLVWVFRGKLFPATAANPDAHNLRIVTTSPLLQDIAKGVGGDFVEVRVVGQNDTAAIYAADVFIYVGDASDSWGEEVAPELAKRSIVPVKALTGGNTSISPEVRKQLAPRLIHLFGFLDAPHAPSYTQRGQQYITSLQ